MAIPALKGVLLPLEEWGLFMGFIHGASMPDVSMFRAATSVDVGAQHAALRLWYHDHIVACASLLSGRHTRSLRLAGRAWRCSFDSSS